MQGQSKEQDSPAAAYDLFASAYDHFFAPEALDTTVRALEILLFCHLGPKAEILDLCCGTGRLTQVLAQRGYGITGVDSSPQMLSMARDRVPGTDLLQADIRNFSLPSGFDAVVCAYNSLPHITAPGDLAKVFRCVRRCLRPGGIFVFDLFSPAAYEQRWHGSFARVEDYRVCLVQAHFDRESARGENLITIFEHSDVWKRTDFKLTTRCYADAELRGMLAAAGFTACRNFDLSRELGMDLGGRIFWRCTG